MNKKTMPIFQRGFSFSNTWYLWKQKFTYCHPIFQEIYNLSWQLCQQAIFFFYPPGASRSHPFTVKIVNFNLLSPNSFFSCTSDSGAAFLLVTTLIITNIKNSNHMWPPTGIVPLSRMEPSYSLTGYTI